MWSGNNWPQWPIQQAMYANMPHDQVDWAALAKQWIDMQHVPGEGGGPPPPMPGNFPGAPPLQGPPHALPHSGGGSSMDEIYQQTPDKLIANPTEIIEATHIMQTSSSDALLPVPEGVSSSEPNPLPPETFWSNTWEPSASAWTSSSAPIMGPTLGPGPMDSKGAFHSTQPPAPYGASMHGNLTSQGYDYNEPYAPHTQNFMGYWSNTGAIPPFMRKDKMDDSSMLMGGDEMAQMANLDAAKRKHLPIWIREGLEKMERDRQRQEEKERMKREYEERRKMNTSLAVEHDMQDEQEALGKSRFDSESEDEEAEPEEPGKVLTDEEMIFKTRRMLTEILLQVTNDEVVSVCKEVLQRARNKAPAKQLASSSALASITGVLGGLEGYGSNDEDDDESDMDNNRRNSGADDSDAELERIIWEKKKWFAEKQKQIEATLLEAENKEREEEAAKEEIAASKPQLSTPPVTLQPQNIPNQSAELDIKPEYPVITLTSDKTGNKISSSSSSSVSKDSDSESSKSSKEKINGRKNKRKSSSPETDRRKSSGKRRRDRSDSRSRNGSSKRRDISRDRSRRSSSRSSRRDKKRVRSRSRDRDRSRNRSRDNNKKDRRSRSRSRDSRRNNKRDNKSRSRSRGRNSSRDRRNSRDSKTKTKDRKRSSKRSSSSRSSSEASNSTKSRSGKKSSGKRKRV